MSSSRPETVAAGRRRLLVVVALVAVLALTVVFTVVKAITGSRARGPSDACSGIHVRPGDSIGDVLDNSPEGAVICVGAGLYRLTEPLLPKRGQQLQGVKGAVLDGARVVEGWGREGSTWVLRGQLPPGPRPYGHCVFRRQACRYAESLFRDGAMLGRVERREDVIPGWFYADYQKNEITIADDPAGHLMEMAQATAAVTGPADDVVVKGLVIQKFANPAQRGAIEPQGPDWRIEGNDIRLNHGHGVQVAADRTTVRANRLHHNGQLGLGSGAVVDQLVEDNEIAHNNKAYFSSFWEAGGAKWAEVRNLTVRRNWVHDNEGPGLWTDINCTDVVFEENLVTGNADAGIRHEISYRSTIRKNRLIGNGRSAPYNNGWGPAGIEIAGSSDVEIDGNEVVGNVNGIVLSQQHRTDSPSPMGPHDVHDIWVHHNTVTLDTGVTGMVNDTGDSRHFSAGVRFDDNTYSLSDPTVKPFAWMQGMWERADWTGRFGQDRNSKFIITP